MNEKKTEYLIIFTFGLLKGFLKMILEEIDIILFNGLGVITLQGYLNLVFT